MSDDDDNTVQRFPASIAEDGDDPDLTPADAETGYMHEGADEDEYSDEELILVAVQRFLASIAQDRDDPDLTPADAETDAGPCLNVQVILGFPSIAESDADHRDFGNVLGTRL